MDLRLSLQALQDLFTFPFRDPRWKEKFLIGSGLTLASSFIPMLPFLATLGYGARLARAGAVNSDPAQLPEWDDWGDLLLDGLRQFGALLVFLLPPILIIIAGNILYLVSTIFITTLDNNPRMAGPLLLVIFGGFFALMLSIFIGMALAFVSWMIIPVTQAHVAITRRFGALFAVSTWWSVLRANWVNYLLIFLLLVALYFFSILAVQILYLTIVLCLLAPVAISPLMFYTQVIIYRLAGQVYGAEGEQA